MLTTLFNIYESKWCMASSNALSGFSRPYFVWCTLSPRTWVCSDHARFYLVWCDFLNRHFSNHRCTQVENPGGWFSQIFGSRCRWCCKWNSTIFSVLFNFLWGSFFVSPTPLLWTPLFLFLLYFFKYLYVSAKGLENHLLDVIY